MAMASRGMRSPLCPFNIKSYPYQITPFLIHPVLPGETLKSAMFQMKAVTPPLNDTLIGMWSEQFFFYVKLSQLGDEYKEMVVDPAYNAVAASLTSTTDKARHYFATGATRPGIDYVNKCLEAILPVWFRDDGEALAAGQINSEYSAKIMGKSVIDSFKLTSEYEATTVDIPVDLDADATITASEVLEAQRRYLSMMQQGLENKSYEDFMRSYGVNVKDEAVSQVPELLRYLRDWSAPTRLVETSTGTPTAACQWAVQEKMDKARYFKEPGFIFGVTCFRPKVYLKNWKGTATSYFQTALHWLPGDMINNVEMGIEHFATLTGPHETCTAGYAIDLRDLLLHGEQFVNHDLATAKGTVSLPATAGTDAKYATTADVQALFTSTDYEVKADGVFMPRIASKLYRDHTPNA